MALVEVERCSRHCFRVRAGVHVTPGAGVRAKDVEDDKDSGRDLDDADTERS